MKGKKKKTKNNKLKKKRHKKYEGAAAQSARDKKKKENNNYRSASDLLIGYKANINSLSNKLLPESSYSSAEILKGFSGIQNKLAAFNSFARSLPNLDHLKPRSPALDWSRHATLSYTKLSNLSTIQDMSSFVIPQLPRWYNETFIKGSLLSEHSYSSLDIFRRSQSLSEIIGSDRLSAFSVQSNLAKATEFSLYAEKSLSSFPWTDMGRKVSLSEYAKGIFSNSFLELSNEYSGLLKSFEKNPKSFAELNPALTNIAPIEFYTGADFLESISGDEDATSEEDILKKEIQYENEYSLSTYLPKVNPGLLNMWKGAIETFHSSNSDKVRQFSASLRELFTHLMHLLAPDNQIKSWTSDSTFYHEGKPTRKARLHYICRNISNEPFNKFLEKDIQATIEFITIFQEGTHSIESDFSPQQLIALKSKAETTLKFLLEIEFSANQI